MQYLMIIIYIFFTTGGITLMKMGGDSLHLTLSDGFALSMGWKTFAGFCFYIISFLLWQRLIVKYNLSIMVPIVNGVVQLVILGLGTIVFREKISTVTLIGAFVVIAGIVIMAFGTQGR